MAVRCSSNILFGNIWHICEGSCQFGAQKIHFHSSWAKVCDLGPVITAAGQKVRQILFGNWELFEPLVLWPRLRCLPSLRLQRLQLTHAKEPLISRCFLLNIDISIHPHYTYIVVVIEKVLILVDREHDIEAIPSWSRVTERLFPKLTCGEPFAKNKINCLQSADMFSTYQVAMNTNF